MNKRLMKNMGGPGAMQFGMGEIECENLREADEWHQVADVAGEDEAKDSLQEVVEYLHNPTKYRDIGAKMPKNAPPRGPARHGQDDAREGCRR